MRVALYARVSKDDGTQDPENQLHEMREYVTRQGWTLIDEYVDRATGKNADRKHFKRMMRDAEAKHFDLLVFWALDRLSREGVLETLQHLRRLNDWGVNWQSRSEQHIDSCGIFKDVIISLMATLAKQERIRISERTKAGLRRVQAAGKHIGRPALPVDVARLRELQASGVKTRDLPEHIGLSRATIMRALRVT